MRTLMQLILNAAGGRAWAQLIAATLIGALLPLLTRHNNEHAANVPLLPKMLGFGVAGFLVGAGLIFKDVAGLQIQQRQAAGQSARGWKLLRAVTLTFIVLLAVLSLCLIMAMAF